MLIKNVISSLVKLGLLLATLTLSSGAYAQVALSLTTGWNLLGNSSVAPIDVATMFGDASKITTVWKWNKIASKWVFYAPSMTPSTLTVYAQGKGYDVLTSIDPKEGFWVNASTAVTLTGPVANGVTLIESDLQQGWNLMGSADNKTPLQLNQGLNSSLNAAGKKIVTAWAWDAPSKLWKFYAPSLEEQGGTVLSDYITSKAYLPFSTALSASDGFWLNIGAATSNSTMWAIGGSISGVSPGASVTLQNNGADNLMVTSNGSFVFATPASNGGSYSVTVLAQPSGETCTVAGGSGTASTNVTSVTVTCSATLPNCPAVTGAATLSLTTGLPFHSFVLQTPANANNVSYSSYSFDFSLQTYSSPTATVTVTDGKNPSVSVADLGAVCGLGGIASFPTKVQFSSVGALILQTGHGYFVEAPNGSYARLYVSNVTNGSGVDIQYEYPSVICPSSGVSIAYDIDNLNLGGIKQTYNGVSISGTVSQGGNVNNNNTHGSAYSTPFFGCNAIATVQAWGGGGGGGGYYDLIGGAGGGGGGGGGYGSQSLSLSPGQYYLVTIGAGGSSSGGMGLNGSNGQSTVFSTYSATDTAMTGTSLFTSTGGQAGKAPTSHTASGIGGAWGTSNATGTSSPGQPGTNGVTVASSPCSLGQVWGIGPGGSGGNAGESGGAGATGGCTPGSAGIPGGGGAGNSQYGGPTSGAMGRVIISY